VCKSVQGFYTFRKKKLEKKAVFELKCDPEEAYSFLFDENQRHSFSILKNCWDNFSGESGSK
jgi:hypothetical protein